MILLFMLCILGLHAASLTAHQEDHRHLYRNWSSLIRSPYLRNAFRVDKLNFPANLSSEFTYGRTQVRISPDSTRVILPHPGSQEDEYSPVQNASSHVHGEDEDEAEECAENIRLLRKDLRNLQTLVSDLFLQVVSLRRRMDVRDHVVNFTAHPVQSRKPFHRRRTSPPTTTNPHP